MSCSLYAFSRPSSTFSSHGKRISRTLSPTPLPSSLRPRLASLCFCCSTASPTAPPKSFKCQTTGEDETEGGGAPATKQPHFVGRNSDQDAEKEETGLLGDEKGISGIYVPRQKYICVSKEDLLEAILSMFESDEDAEEFARFAKCLDSILHAEHKDILEQMRIYYAQIHAGENLEKCTPTRNSEEMNTGLHFPYDSMGLKKINGKKLENYDNSQDSYNILNLRSLFVSTFGNVKTNPATGSRLIAAHFQNTFMNLLQNAQFEELSAEDLLLTYALNTDYLLTLPIYVDRKRASKSNAVIFRRGYTTERQKGLLIIEKLDFLQSKLLQEGLFNISRRLKKLAIWINEAYKNSSLVDGLKESNERAKAWLKKQTFPLAMQSFTEGTYNDQWEAAESEANELPIWLAAQRAAPRYEGLLSSIGPRGRLMRKFLTWIGFTSPMSEASLEIDAGGNESEDHIRSNFLPRITLTDIWKPASKESCGNNAWKMLRAGASILFSSSILQEPAFQELILLYTEAAEGTASGSMNLESMPLKLKIYERIPYPDLPVIFPHKKLSFRILDTVRLDVASILGLLAFFVNYKFENILSSPSAVFLDVVAISALILYVTRVALGYKQTWDRYQLLVNRTLYEKTLASGFGSVHFLLDASEQQQYKEAILAYAILLHAERFQIYCCKNIGDACEKFLYERFQEKVEMPTKKAIDTLLRLGIIKKIPDNEKSELKALPCNKAYEALRHHWDSLLS